MHVIKHLFLIASFSALFVYAAPADTPPSGNSTADGNSTDTKTASKWAGLQNVAALPPKEPAKDPLKAPSNNILAGKTAGHGNILNASVKDTMPPLTWLPQTPMMQVTPHPSGQPASSQQSLSAAKSPLDGPAPDPKKNMLQIDNSIDPAANGQKGSQQPLAAKQPTSGKASTPGEENIGSVSQPVQIDPGNNPGQQVSQPLQQSGIKGAAENIAKSTDSKGAEETPPAKGNNNQPFIIFPSNDEGGEGASQDFGGQSAGMQGQTPPADTAPPTAPPMGEDTPPPSDSFGGDVPPSDTPTTEDSGPAEGQVGEPQPFAMVSPPKEQVSEPQQLVAEPPRQRTSPPTTPDDEIRMGVTKPATNPDTQDTIPLDTTFNDNQRSTPARGGFTPTMGVVTPPEPINQESVPFDPTLNGNGASSSNFEDGRPQNMPPNRFIPPDNTAWWQDRTPDQQSGAAPEIQSGQEFPDNGSATLPLTTPIVQSAEGPLVLPNDAKQPDTPATTPPATDSKGPTPPPNDAKGPTPPPSDAKGPDSSKGPTTPPNDAKGSQPPKQAKKLYLNTNQAPYFENGTATPATKQRAQAQAVTDPLAALPSAVVPTLSTKQMVYASRSLPGDVVQECSTPGVMALTFDDGPSSYTASLLDYLAKENIKATFFINGVNYFDIRAPRWALLVARMYNEGHQIGLHGWSHADLATLSADGVRQEMKTLDQAIQRIIGVSPRYMRPPFGSVNADTLRVLRDELKYRVILWNIETKDSYHNGDVSQDMQAYQDAFSQPNYEKHGYISLQHDPIPTTVSQLTLQAVALARQKKLKLVTVAECLGDTGKEYWQPSP